MPDSQLDDILTQIALGDLRTPRPASSVPLMGMTPPSAQDVAGITERNQALAELAPRTTSRDIFNTSHREAMATPAAVLNGQETAAQIAPKVAVTQRRNEYALVKSILESAPGEERRLAFALVKTEHPDIYERVVDHASRIASEDGDAGMIDDAIAAHTVTAGMQSAPSAQAAIPGLEQNAIARERAGMIAQQEQDRIGQLPGIVQPIAGGLRGGVDGAINGLGRLVPGMGAIADLKTRDAQAARTGQMNAYDAARVNPTYADLASGVSQAVPSMVAGMVAPGGAAVKFATSVVPQALATGNEGYVEGKDAGMGEGGATLYGFLQGGIEGSIASIMQAAGRGGLESVYQPIKDQIKRGVLAWSKDVGKGMLDEQVEELSTSLAQQYARSLAIDGRMPNADEVNKTAVDTVLTTGILTGGVKAASLPGEVAHNDALKAEESRSSPANVSTMAKLTKALEAPKNDEIKLLERQRAVAAQAGDFVGVQRLDALLAYQREQAQARQSPRDPNIPTGSGSPSPDAGSTTALDAQAQPDDTLASEIATLGPPGGETADLGTTAQIDRYLGEPNQQPLPVTTATTADEQIADMRMRREGRPLAQREIPGPLGGTKRGAAIDRQVEQRVAADRAAASAVAQENRDKQADQLNADMQAASDLAQQNRQNRDQALESAATQEQSLQRDQNRRIAQQAVEKLGEDVPPAMVAAAADGDIDAVQRELDSYLQAQVEAQRQSPAAAPRRASVTAQEVMGALAADEAAGKPRISHQQMAARLAQQKQIGLNQQDEAAGTARAGIRDRLARIHRARQSLKQGRATNPPVSVPTPEVAGPFETQEAAAQIGAPAPNPGPMDTQEVLDASRPQEPARKAARTPPQPVPARKPAGPLPSTPANAKTVVDANLQPQSKPAATPSTAAEPPAQDAPLLNAADTSAAPRARGPASSEGVTKRLAHTVRTLWPGSQVSEIPGGISVRFGDTGRSIEVLAKADLQAGDVNWGSWWSSFVSSTHAGDTKAAGAAFQAVTGASLPKTAAAMESWARQPRNAPMAQALLGKYAPRGGYASSGVPVITMREVASTDPPRLAERIMHEFNHWAVDVFVPEKGKQQLLARIRQRDPKGSYSTDPNDRAGYRNFLEGAEAEYRIWKQQQTAAKLNNGIFGKLIGRITDFFGRLRKVAKNAPEGLVQPDALFRAIESGRAFQGDGTGSGVEAMAIGDQYEFVPSPRGGIDFGKVDADVARAIGVQPGTVIRLQRGRDDGHGGGHGLRHLEANATRKRLGGKDVPAFTQEMVDNLRRFDIYREPGGAFKAIVNMPGGQKMVLTAKAQDGGFLAIQTLNPVDRVEDMRGKKADWRGEGFPHLGYLEAKPGPVAPPVKPDDGQPRPDGQSNRSIAGPGENGNDAYGLDASSVADVVANWEKSGIDGFASERNGVITVSKIVVHPGLRGRGDGTRAMRAMIDYAERTGQYIALTPSAAFGGSASRLREFYGRLGFKKNAGRSRKLTVGEDMVWTPTNPSSVVYALDATNDDDGGDSSARVSETPDESPSIEQDVLLQRIRDGLEPAEVESFAQWDKDARRMLRGDGIERLLTRLERNLAGDGKMKIGPEDQRALRIAFVRAMERGDGALAARIGWVDDQVGTETARSLGARRFLLSTPEGRREWILSYFMTPSAATRREMNKAKGNPAEQAAIMGRWSERSARAKQALKDQFGVDVNAPNIGDQFSDLYSLGALVQAISNQMSPGLTRDNVVDALVTNYKLALLTHPGTHGVNTASNAANFAKVVTRQHVEAVLGSILGGKPDAATVGEIGPLWRGLARGFPMAVQAAFRSFAAGHDVTARTVRAQQQTSKTQTADVPTVPGLRTFSTRPMAFADSFFKTWTGYAMVAQEAYRRAKTAGMSDADVENEVAGALVGPNGSNMQDWENAIRRGSEVTFQDLGEELTGQERWLTGLARTANSASRTFPPISFIIPFVNTPLSITAQTMALVPPAKAIAMVTRGIVKSVKGEPYGRGEALRDVGDLIMGSALMSVMLMALGDDDDERPWITGVETEFTDNRGRAEMERSGQAPPPMSVRIGDRYYSYKWAAPMAPIIASMSDAARLWRNGKTLQQVVGVTSGKVLKASVLDQAGMIETTTDFARGMINGVIAGSSESKMTGDGYLGGAASNLANRAQSGGARIIAGSVPYLGWALTRGVSNDLRSLNEGGAMQRTASRQPNQQEVFDGNQAPTFGRQLQQYADPTGTIESRPPAYRDRWGNPVNLGVQDMSDFWQRTLMRDAGRPLSQNAYDLEILRRARNDPTPYYPTDWSPRYKDGGEQKVMTESQYDQFIKFAGKAWLEQLEKTPQVLDKTMPQEQWRKTMTRIKARAARIGRIGALATGRADDEE